MAHSQGAKQIIVELEEAGVSRKPLLRLVEKGQDWIFSWDGKDKKYVEVSPPTPKGKTKEIRRARAQALWEGLKVRCVRKRDNRISSSTI